MALGTDTRGVRVSYFPLSLWSVPLSCSHAILKTELSGRWLQVTPPNSILPQGQEKDAEERDSRDSSQHRKRKKRPQPKALFMPPPRCTFGEPGPGRCHQSCLRSPVFLVDRLLKGLFQCPPYTPPPMLSPIREGSGLYFSTLCFTSAQAGPDKLLSTMLGEWASRGGLLWAACALPLSIWSRECLPPVALAPWLFISIPGPSVIGSLPGA